MASKLEAIYAQAQWAWRRERERTYVTIIFRHDDPQPGDGEALRALLADLGLSAGDVTTDVRYLQAIAPADAAVKAAEDQLATARREVADADALCQSGRQLREGEGATAYEKRRQKNAVQQCKAVEALELAMNVLNQARAEQRRIASERPARIGWGVL